MWAFDDLYLRTIEGSDYEAFGATCGDRIETDELCTEHFGDSEAFALGDVPELDAL
jgi:hypothetical protein